MTDKKTLAQYAAENPAAQPPQDQEPGKDVIARWGEFDRAEMIKRQILRSVKAGEAPQVILYKAAECIGLYSADPNYTDQLRAELDGIYADLAQQSLLIDEAAEAAERLKEKQAEYNHKLKEDLRRRFKAAQRIESDLLDLINSIADIEAREAESNPAE